MDSVLLYIGIFFLASVFLNEGKKRYGSINIYAFIGLCILVVFAAGRYHVGTDCHTYIHMFERYAVMPWSEILTSGEVLFCAVAKICYMQGGRVLTWAVFALLTALPVYLTVSRQYQKSYAFAAFFSFLSIYFAFSFNITRQYIAVAFIVWGMKFVFENKLVPFVLVVLFATGFHLSAPIALMMWFLWDHKMDAPISGRKRILLLIGITLVIFVYQEVITYVTSNISMFESYASYTETSTRGQNRDLYLYIAELVVLLLLRPRMNVDDERVEVMYSLLIISVLIGFTGFTHPQIKRLAVYFAVPAKTVLFGYLPNCFTENSKWLSSVLICIYAAAYFILVAYVLGESHLIPYQFDLYSAW